MLRPCDHPAARKEFGGASPKQASSSTREAWQAFPRVHGGSFVSTVSSRERISAIPFFLQWMGAWLGIPKLKHKKEFRNNANYEKIVHHFFRFGKFAPPSCRTRWLPIGGTPWWLGQRTWRVLQSGSISSDPLPCPRRRGPRSGKGSADLPLVRTGMALVVEMGESG
jgi:hypothetical protein